MIFSYYFWHLTTSGHSGLPLYGNKMLIFVVFHREN